MLSSYINSLTSAASANKINSLLCAAFFLAYMKIRRQYHPFFLPSQHKHIRTRIIIVIYTFWNKMKMILTNFHIGENLSAYSDNLGWNDMVGKLDFLVSFLLLLFFFFCSAKYQQHISGAGISNNHFCFVALFYAFFVSVFHIFSIVYVYVHMENVDHVWCVL